MKTKNTVQTKQAKTITRKNGVKVAIKAAKVAAIVSNQWKAAREAGIDALMGHGGIYNVRKSDCTANIVAEGKAKGSLSRKVAIFSGARGLCFVDGNANADKQFIFGGHTLNIGNIKKVLFFGDVAGAVAFVRKSGKAEAGSTKKHEAFTHYFSNGAHYAIATDGKRLLRLEAFNCSGRAGEHVWTLGKVK